MEEEKLEQTEQKATKNKKTLKIVIISIAVLLILAGAVGAVLWTQTNMLDFMKSDRTLFFNYLNQNLDGLPSFERGALERLGTESYTSNTTLSWELGGSEAINMLGEDLDIINAITLVLLERGDRDNGRFAYELALQSEDEEIISAEVVFDRNELSLGLSPILEQAITIENRNLGQLAELLGMDSTLVPDSIELDAIFEGPTLTSSEWQGIKRRYTKAITNALCSDNFSSSREEIQVDGREVRANAYTLTITELDLVKIGINLLEELKDDELLLDYILEILEFLPEEFTEGTTLRRGHIQGELENLIYTLKEQKEELIELEERENILVITVYEHRGNTVLTRFEVADTARLDVERDSSRNEVEFTFIAYERPWSWENATTEMEEIGRLNLTVTRDGRNHTFELEIAGAEIAVTINRALTYLDFKLEFSDNGLDVKLNLEMNIEFEDVEVEMLTNNTVLNDKTEDDIAELVEDLINALERLGENHSGRLQDIIEELAGLVIFEVELMMNSNVRGISAADMIEEILIATSEGDEYREQIEITLLNNRVIAVEITVEFDDAEFAEELYEFLIMMQQEGITLSGNEIRMSGNLQDLGLVRATREQVIEMLEADGFIIQ